MSDPIAFSRDELVGKTSSSPTPENNKTQEMNIVSPADVPRSKLQIAAILLALNVGLCIYPP